jgi:hypothetical protein
MVILEREAGGLSIDKKSIIDIYDSNEQYNNEGRPIH